MSKHRRPKELGIAVDEPTNPKNLRHFHQVVSQIDRNTSDNPQQGSQQLSKHILAMAVARQLIRLPEGARHLIRLPEGVNAQGHSTI
eukprot:1014328-Amphidinium_carterae.3